VIAIDFNPRLNKEWRKREEAMKRQDLVDLRPQDLHLIGEDDLDLFPAMVSWFNPLLLFRLLKPVIISQIFGEYADRRLIHAALNGETDVELLARADLRAEKPAAPIWIDYVSDLGDGFDATYAIAYLMAQPSLHVDDYDLPRGSLVVMGGDEVYPYATTEDYRLRMRHPYGLALPLIKNDPKPPFILAVPGNHDWYDGLARFLAIFCRKESTKIGGWRTRQRRSYFAARLTESWWLWGIDIALIEDMDQPQADYFGTMAQHMENANLIICSSEPGWYNAAENSKAFRSLSYAAWIAEKADKNIKIALCLSGDTHHYARYTTEFGTEFMTAGGGGAFLHGTHQLPCGLKLDWLKHRDAPASLVKKKADGSEYAACYPDKRTSRIQLLRNLWFPLSNRGFSLALGIFYAFAGCLLLKWPIGGSVFVTLLLIAFCLGYISYQESRRTPVIRAMAALLAFVQSAAHFVAIWAATRLFTHLNALWFGADLTPWLWWPLFGLEMVVAGTIVGGLIFGVSLLLGSGVAHIAHNDAFSAMRLNSYRHFLRIRIEGSKLTIFPIGLDHVPQRSGWRKASDAEIAQRNSIFQPKQPLRARLIEDPIALDANNVR
jgi:hypothetical protein